MAQLPSLSGTVNVTMPDNVIPLHPDLSKKVAQAQNKDLTYRLKEARAKHNKTHSRFSDINEALMDYLHTSMREAVSFKASCGVTDRLKLNIDAMEGRYQAEDYQMMGGRETAIWYNLTERLSRTMIAFLRKTVAGSEIDHPQYEFAPTTIPDPPPDMLARAEDAVIEFLELSVLAGVEINPDVVRNMLEQLADTLYENVKAETLKSLRRAKREVDDALQKLDWSMVIDEILHDLVVHGTTILYGPYPELRKVQYYTNDINNPEIKVRTERYIQAKRIDPNRFYPSPDSKDTQDGAFVIWHDTMTRQQLIEAQSLGGGWNEKAICTILEEYKTKSRYWCASNYIRQVDTNTEEEHISGKNTRAMWSNNEDIDVLKYFGKVPAQLLLEHGINTFDGRKINTKESLEVEIFWVGDDIIYVDCNRDPLCERPFQKATLFDRPGSFWGRGAPETIEPQQKMANAHYRAVASNNGFTAKPIFEYDKALTRPQGENRTYSDDIFPGKIIEKNSMKTGLTGQALHIHQIDSRIAEFMNGIEYNIAAAEHILGLPRFLTGAHTGGGAARTFSGLQQLTENAAIQIRSSMINLDFGLIKPFLKRMHRWVVTDRKDPLLYSDIEVVTQGASALLAREVNKDRLTSLIGLLLPFAQSGLVTQQGIGYILGQLITDHGLDPDLVLTDQLELQRFADVFRLNLQGVGGFSGGQAAAGAPGGTIAQAGAGAPQLDPIAALAATGQAPLGVGGGINPVQQLAA